MINICLIGLLIVHLHMRLPDVEAGMNSTSMQRGN